MAHENRPHVRFWHEPFSDLFEEMHDLLTRNTRTRFMDPREWPIGRQAFDLLENRRHLRLLTDEQVDILDRENEAAYLAALKEARKNTTATIEELYTAHDSVGMPTAIRIHGTQSLDENGDEMAPEVKIDAVGDVTLLRDQLESYGAFERYGKQLEEQQPALALKAPETLALEDANPNTSDETPDLPKA